MSADCVLSLARQLSLFLDVVKSLCCDLTQDQFVSEERGGCSSAAGPAGVAVRRGRAALWRLLRGTPLSLGGWSLPSPVHLKGQGLTRKQEVALDRADHRSHDLK